MGTVCDPATFIPLLSRFPVLKRYRRPSGPPAHGSRVVSFDPALVTADTLAFAPDGKLLASGSQDRTVRLWEVAHYQARKP
jgi:WD40 repeat protein